MKDYIVWIDSKSAHIFALQNSEIKKSVVTKAEVDHHNRHNNDNHGQDDSDTEHFFRDLAAGLKTADHLLLIGPGLAKKKFQSHLESHQKNTLAKKVIGIENFESFEHKSENQLLAAARDFFKKYDLYNSPI